MRAPSFSLLLVLLALLGCRQDASKSASPPAAPVKARQAPSPGSARLSGRVVLDDAPSPARFETVASVERHCGPTVEDPSLKVASDGGLAEAVVYLDVAEGPRLAETPGPVLDQVGCRYAPAVLGARAGAQLSVRNSDPLIHNVRSVAGGRSLFNVAMPLEGMQVLRTLPTRTGVVEVGCDLHPWMRATVRTFAHDWFTGTDADGRFILEGLPEGRYRIGVWHPRLPEQHREVELVAGQAAELEVRWSGDAVRPLTRLAGSR